MNREQYKAQTNAMWEEENYLEALRRGCSLKELSQCQAAFFSDFIEDGKEPDEDKKDFLSALQITAKYVLEQRTIENQKLNARVCVKMDEDEMGTWMFLFPPFRDGKDIKEELIMDVLDECGVIYGIDRTMIKKIVNSKSYLKLFRAAEGTKPQTGVPGKIIDHYPRTQVLKESELAGVEEIEKDFLRLEGMHTVSVGDVICDVHLPKKSTDGMTVKGEILVGEQVPPLDLPIGENVGLNESKDAIVAKIDGTLIFDQGKFTVNDILILFQDVDMASGNVDVIGSLDVHGDVQSGFHVSATGNVHIYGMVGNSKVTAGGDITIGMGVRGINGAVLKAGGNIYCKYMENCKVGAKGHVITESIINCDVHSDDYVETQKIVGGSVRALHKVHAKVIGIAQRRETMIYLGLSQDTLNERITLERRIQELDVSTKELVKNVRYLKSQRKLDEKGKEQLYQMINKEAAQKKEISEHKGRLLYLEDVINDVSECELTANLIYPPVKVMMRSDSIFINREENMCRIWSSDGEMRMR